MPLGTALVLGFLFALSVGLTSGILIAYATIPAIFTTLAMGLIVYGSRARLAVPGRRAEHAVQHRTSSTFLVHANILGIPMMIVAFAALSLILWVLLRIDALRPLRLCDRRQSARRRASPAFRRGR